MRGARTAQADEEASGVVAFERGVRRDDIGDGYRRYRNDAGGNGYRLGRADGHLEHRQIARPPQRAEAQRLRLAGLAGDEFGVVGVRMGARETDRTE
jgi:hypothetical protein